MNRIKYLLGISNYYLWGVKLPNNYLPFVGTISRKIRIFLLRQFCLDISKSANICKNVYIGNGKNIKIGNNSSLGINSRIENTHITIGNDVMTGASLLVIGGGHIFTNKQIPMRLQGTLQKSELVIEDDVWIGARVTITKGCKKIGKGSIIGAGSVVTHDVAPYTIVAGNPARKIRDR